MLIICDFYPQFIVLSILLTNIFICYMIHYLSFLG